MQRVSLSLVAALLVYASPAHADAFDHYTNQILVKVPGSKQARECPRLTPDMLVKHARVLPGVPGAFLVVRTNEGKMAKLLVQPKAGQKVRDKVVPVFLIDRFVTYRMAEERAIHVQGKMLRLFPGFHLDLEMGQIVPAELGGDLRFVVQGDTTCIEAVGDAKIYLVTRHFTEADPGKHAPLEIGAAFEPRYFNGEYKLYDDGRRTGILHLKVHESGEVTGAFYSDKDGRKYEVAGKIADPPHSINFRITYPRTVQHFHGWLFTGDGKALTGSSRMQERETGFYAIRK
jgi:hypothetical protein